MPFPITFPRLGWSMETGQFVEWNKHDGDSVEKGEILFTAEGDKAVQDIESMESGILRILPDSPRPGEEVPVGTVLGYLVRADEAAPQGAATADTEMAGATKEGIPGEQHKDAGPHRQSGYKRASSKNAISPRARRVAQALGVDWAAIKGSGRTGRIVEQDIIIIGASQAPMAGEHVVIANTHESGTTPVSATMSSEADVTELVEFQHRLDLFPAFRGETVPQHIDFVVKLTATALGQHPEMNGVFRNDTVITSDEIHIAVAAYTAQGLRVPVIRSVPLKSVCRIADELRQLEKRAQRGQLDTNEMHGATFTVIDLGTHNVDTFTGVIDLSQSAVLGLGRIVTKPVAHGRDILVRDMMSLSLVFDQRIVDGGHAAHFLDTIRRYVEQPDVFLAI